MEIDLYFGLLDEVNDTEGECPGGVLKLCIVVSFEGAWFCVVVKVVKDVLQLPPLILDVVYHLISVLEDMCK